MTRAGWLDDIWKEKGKEKEEKKKKHTKERKKTT